MTDPISASIASQAAQAMQEQAQPEVAPSGGKSFAEVLNAPQSEPGAAPETAPIEASAQIDETQRLDAYIEGILGDEGRIHELLESSMRGDALGPQEMLEMQALIYSYSQKVELTTKVVEKATGGIKQVMNTQV
ncbi:hypothetical protein DL240_01535 [Lujinxingia litoralis]|uniref:Uncharacterized protein n=1 Tax=Lujinxingia litoralis TaxID=2211119 RepID=A0A328CAD7_9DELT|nr:hypothetical protein [Lujinxingia litoralis]RAL24918.1 hypothetical protein DL240_01535 [Lujinxingia litoralis]